MIFLLAFLFFAFLTLINSASYVIKVDISNLNTMDSNYQYYTKLAQGAASLVQQMISPVQSNTNLITYIQNSKFPLNSAITIPDMTNFPTNLDLVVFIGQLTDPTRPYLCMGQALTMSQSLGRPVVGQLIINIANFNDASTYSSLYFQYQLRMFVRAFFKIMGLDMQLLSSWIQQTNQMPYASSQQIQTITVRGNQQNALITPNVVLKSNNHFNCQNQGMALSPIDEFNQIQWDPLFMNYEIMSAGNFDTIDISISSMTLAALEDTGWYNPVFTYAEVPIWGYNEGCNFISQACPQTATNVEFCNNPVGTIGQDITGFGTGPCTQYQKSQCNYIQRNTTSPLPSNQAKQQCSNNNYCSQQGMCSLDINKCSCFDSTASGGDCSCTVNTQFYSLPNMFCMVCQSPCAQCTSATLCLTCAATFLYQKNTQQCLSQCLPGYGAIDPTQPGICVPCIKGCDVCTNNNQCAKCNPAYGYNSVDQKCYAYCPAGTYKQTVPLMPNPAYCTNCEIGCNLCYDGLSCKTCASQYYLDATKTCVLCPLGCTSCQSATNCTTCSQSYIPVPTQFSCVQSCPTTTYFDGVHQICSQCLLGCSTCTNGTVCLICQKQYQITPNGGCSQYCTNHCQVCDLVQINNCSICLSGYLLTADNTCLSPICQIGQYFDLAAQKCKLCIQSCKVCTNNTQCQNCSVGNYLDSQTNSYTYNMCLNCPPQCSACANSSSCSSCSNGYNYYAPQSSCLKVCPGSTFASTQQCQSCAKNCIQCISSQVCQVCQNKYQMDIYFVSYYLNSNQACVSCDVSCNNCSVTATNCTACNAGFTLLPGDASCVTTCPAPTTLNNNVCQCPSGTVRSNKNCVICDLSCYQCFGIMSNQCSACTGIFYLNATYVNNTIIAGQCNQTCPSSQYQDQLSNKCLPCHQYCLNCFGPTSMTCTACRQGFASLNTTCSTQCPTNYYSNQSAICSPCNIKCLNCTGGSENECNQCATNYLLAGNSCLSICPIGYITNSSTRLCTQCLTNFVVDTQICQDNCPQIGYYQETYNQTALCKQCAISNCSSCLDKYSCQQCQDGYYMDNVGCKQCSQNCNTCTQRANKCTDCKTGTHLHYQNYRCISDCTSQQFSNNGICSNCTQPCQTCVSQSNCTSCLPNFFLDTGACKSSCNIGSYLIQNLGVCAKCDVSCLECSGPNDHNCIKCSPKQLLIQNRCASVCSTCQPNNNTKLTYSFLIKPLVLILIVFNF